MIDNRLRPAPEEIAPSVAAIADHPRMQGVAVEPGHGLQIFVKIEP